MAKGSFLRKPVLIISSVLSLFLSMAHTAEAEKTFSQCLAENGATMYSAWWCPHCFTQLHDLDPTLARRDLQNPERMQEFPFLKECGGKEAGSLLRDCVPKHARGVPMWTFTKEPIPATQYAGGGLPLEEIARRTGCTPPAATPKK
jgi:hypothetical protein